MIRFSCDYAEGAHPLVLDALTRSNMVQTPGYGEDEYCERARGVIRRRVGRDDAYVQFLVGGTQANMTVIAAALRPHQGVISAETGHVSVHETGAIEATGHKVLTVPPVNGKLTAEAVERTVRAHWDDETHEHMVQPGMVYISHPTECGTLYSRSELTALSETCRRNGLLLFLDGARLGYGLAAPGSDVTLQDIARLTDVFYIGGTKVGALFGEAVVILNDALKKDFRYHIKQRGGMLAKGRLLGIQFETLLGGGLYEEIAGHAVRQALRIRDAFLAQGVAMLVDSPTNQQFPILNDGQIEALSKGYAFSPWQRMDETHMAVRFATSWATRAEDVDRLLADIARL